jgi:hypothetical protein
MSSRFGYSYRLYTNEIWALPESVKAPIDVDLAHARSAGFFYETLGPAEVQLGDLRDFLSFWGRVDDAPPEESPLTQEDLDWVKENNKTPLIAWLLYNPELEAVGSKWWSYILRESFTFSEIDVLLRCKKALDNGQTIEQAMQLARDTGK